MIKKPATVSVVSQDVVDLTEEDDEDNNRNRPPTSSRPVRIAFDSCWTSTNFVCIEIILYSSF